jgi:hypothetical protein
MGHVFNNVVVEDRVKHAILEWQIVDAGDLVVQPWPIDKTGIEEILDVDRVHGGFQRSLDQRRFVTGAATGNQNEAAGS